MAITEGIYKYKLNETVIETMQKVYHLIEVKVLKIDKWLHNIMQQSLLSFVGGQQIMND